MHPSAMMNGRRFVKTYLAGRNRLDVLDVGSFDVNGSLRPLFNLPGWNYVGLDLAGEADDNVDIHLMDDGTFPFDDGSFDAVVSTSCFEHDNAFWRTFSEMIRVARDGALIYLNVPSEGPYHPYPLDCWRFMPDAYKALASSFPQAQLLESYITGEGEFRDNVGVFRVENHFPAGRREYDAEFFEEIHSESSKSAEIVLGILFRQFKPRSMVDIGCGSGGWLAAARSLGVEELMGLDGSYAEEAYVLESNTFVPADLNLPLPVDGPFDLAVSLEVAEHLPACRARSFIEDLARLSDVVLFSAAIPLQGGVNHVNEQWQDYWAALFAEYGYKALDIVRPEIWTDERVKWWYRQNIMVFCKDSLIDAIFPGAETAMPRSLRRIHESAYLRIVSCLENSSQAESRLEKSRRDASRLRAQLYESESANKELLDSTCWRITYPLRQAKTILLRLLGKV